MRALLLLVLIGCCLWSEDYQKLTFSDGKVLVGYFNERKGTITLDDGATVAVKIDDIVRREPAIRAQEKLDIPPPVKPPSEEAPQPKTNALPPTTPPDLLPPVEALHQARQRWIAVLREANTHRDGIPEAVAQRLASAKADLDAATTAVRIATESLRAQVMTSR